MSALGGSREKLESEFEAEPRESLVVGRKQRNIASGEYDRADAADAAEDKLFATLGADIDAAVDRMQRQLDESEGGARQDTLEASRRESSEVPSAHFRADGSIVPTPRTSVIRGLRGEHAEEQQPISLDFDDDGHTYVDDGDGYDGDGATEIDSGQSAHNEDSFDQDSFDQDGFDQDGFDAGQSNHNEDSFGQDGFDEESTSPSRLYRLAGQELAYNPSEIDEAVQFHEGPTGVSGGPLEPLARGDLAPGDLAPGDLAPGDLARGDLARGDLAPSEAEDRLHPWFDSVPDQARQQSRGTSSQALPPDIADFSPARGSSAQHKSSAQFKASAEQADIAPLRTVREMFRRFEATSVEINLVQLLIAVAAIGLFTAATLIAWWISS